MPFGTITSNSVAFEPRSPGVYSDATVGFSDPKNEFRIKGGTRTKSGIVTATVTRVKESDVTEGAIVVRFSDVLTLQIQASKSADPAVLDAMASDLASFLTSGTISRLLMGEQ